MKKELLHRLQQKISEVSCNSLRRVYPSQIQEWTGAKNTEIRDFIEELLTERLIDVKYDFQCICGNYSTVYHRNIENGYFCCNECERKYTFEEILDNATVLYELDKSAILEFDDEEIVDFKEISRNMSKVIELSKKKGGTIEMKKMKIFLGSSSEAESIMEDIAYQLQTLECDTLRWNEDGKGIFPPSNNIIDSLIDITKKVNAAVFIFNADDKTWNKKSSVKEMNVVRDNVLLEYGLFAGALGKRNVCMICKGDVHIPTDLLGIKYIDGAKGDMIIKKQLEDWLCALE